MTESLSVHDLYKEMLKGSNDIVLTKKRQADLSHKPEFSPPRTESKPPQPRAALGIVEDTDPANAGTHVLDVSTSAETIVPRISSSSLRAAPQTRSRSRLVERIRNGFFFSSKDQWYQRNSGVQDSQAKPAEYVMHMVFFDRLESNSELSRAGQHSHVATNVETTLLPAGQHSRVTTHKEKPSRSQSAKTSRELKQQTLSTPLTTDLLDHQKKTLQPAGKSEPPILRAKSPLSTRYTRPNKASSEQPTKESSLKSSLKQDKSCRNEDEARVGPPNPGLISKDDAGQSPDIQPTNALCTGLPSSECRRILKEKAEKGQGSKAMFPSPPTLRNENPATGEAQINGSPLPRDAGQSSSIEPTNAVTTALPTTECKRILKDKAEIAQGPATMLPSVTPFGNEKPAHAETLNAESPWERNAGQSPNTEGTNTVKTVLPTSEYTRTLKGKAEIAHGPIATFASATAFDNENPAVGETPHAGSSVLRDVGQRLNIEPAAAVSMALPTLESKAALKPRIDTAHGSLGMLRSAPAFAKTVKSTSLRIQSTNGEASSDKFRSYNSISGRLCSQREECKHDFDARHDRRTMHSQISVEVSPNVFMDLRSAMETLRAVESGRAICVTCVQCQGTLKCVPDAELVMCPDCRITSPMCLEDDIPGRTPRRGVGLGLKLPSTFRAAAVGKW